MSEAEPWVSATISTSPERAEEGRQVGAANLRIICIRATVLHGCRSSYSNSSSHQRREEFLRPFRASVHRFGNPGFRFAHPGLNSYAASRLSRLTVCVGSGRNTLRLRVGRCKLPAVGRSGPGERLIALRYTLLTQLPVSAGRSQKNQGTVSRARDAMLIRQSFRAALVTVPDFFTAFRPRSCSRETRSRAVIHG